MSDLPVGSPVCLADLLAREPSLVSAKRQIEVVDGLVVPLATGDGLASVEQWVREASDAVVADLIGQGITVVDVPGWETRGRPSLFSPEGTVCHHTADQAYSSDYAILWLVQDGRSDLNGPLAQWGLGRRGTVYRIAIGTANHAGPGSWDGLAGNPSVWGIEAANDGIGEPWKSEQLHVYPRLVASLARHTPHKARRCSMHREWASSAGTGKIDPTGIDGDTFRAEVDALLAGHVNEEDFMAALSDGEQRELLDRLRKSAEREQFQNDVLTKIVGPFHPQGDAYGGAEGLADGLRRHFDKPATGGGGSVEIDYDRLATAVADKLYERLKA